MRDEELPRVALTVRLMSRGAAAADEFRDEIVRLLFLDVQRFPNLESRDDRLGWCCQVDERSAQLWLDGGRPSSLLGGTRHLLPFDEGPRAQ